MNARYQIVHHGQVIGRAYVTPDPADSSRKLVSVTPIDRSGDFQANTLELSVTEIKSDSFAVGTPDIQAINELLAQVAIEPWKVTVARFE